MERRGFTLIEVLVATGILGGALVVVLSSVGSSARMQRAAVSHLVEARLLHEKMTELLASPDLTEGFRDGGGFENHPSLLWSVEVDRPPLPFYEGALTDHTSTLLRVVLSLRDSGRPDRTLPPLVEYRSGRTSQ